jgi:hypothetical protein
MRRLHFLVTFFVCGTFLLATSGCGRKHNGPRVIAAGGTVSFQGRPVSDALVVCCPASPSAPAAYGNTDSEGRFQLTTYEPGDGAVAGEYRVTVSKKTVTGMSIEEATAYYQREKKDPPLPTVTHQLPRKYDDAANTPLRAKVVSDKPNEFRLELQ